jgi:hypothetical protein
VASAFVEIRLDLDHNNALMTVQRLHDGAALKASLRLLLRGLPWLRPSRLRGPVPVVRVSENGVPLRQAAWLRGLRRLSL